jgi:hypothetical protein
MAFLSNKEFAARANVATRNLSVYITRGKIVAGADGFFDDTHELNRAFLVKRESKKVNTKPTAATAQDKPARVAKASASDEDLVVNGQDVPGYDKSDRYLKHLQTQKMAQEVRLLKMKEEKQKGQVIPSDLIKPVFLQHNQSFIATFKNGSEEIIRIIGKKKALSGADMAELRGQFINIINEALKKATAATLKSVAGIIEEHSRTRGVGERA